MTPITPPNWSFLNDEEFLFTCPGCGEPVTMAREESDGDGRIVLGLLHDCGFEDQIQFAGYQGRL